MGQFMSGFYCFLLKIVFKCELVSQLLMFRYFRIEKDRPTDQYLVLESSPLRWFCCLHIHLIY